MSIPSPLKQYDFQAILIWWHSPFKQATLYTYKSLFSLEGSYHYQSPTVAGVALDVIGKQLLELFHHTSTGWFLLYIIYSLMQTESATFPVIF